MPSEGALSAARRRFGVAAPGVVWSHDCPPGPPVPPPSSVGSIPRRVWAALGRLGSMQARVYKP